MTTTPDQGDERRAFETAIRLAKLFHQTYEELAPEFGYETRPETREFKHDSANGALMVEVMRRLLPALSAAQPVSAEADRYKRALEAIIANPGGASAKRIATLALGLDGTEQVSAEAGKGECERCGMPPSWHVGAYWCKNQSFVAAPSESVAVSGQVSTGQILALERRSNMTDDEAIRYARSVLALVK